MLNRVGIDFKYFSTIINSVQIFFAYSDPGFIKVSKFCIMHTFQSMKSIFLTFTLTPMIYADPKKFFIKISVYHISA